MKTASWLSVSLLAVCGLAQAADGTLSGVVRDASGATVPRARVTVTQAGTSLKEFAVTKETGDFFLSPLPEGRYSVSVAKEGFALNRQEGIQVSAASPARLEIVLNLGQVAETIDVVASGTPSAASPAPDGTPTRIRVGGQVQATKLTAQARPSYPPGCKAEGVEGTVLLRAVISKEGTPLNLQAVNRLVDARLVDAATEAVRQWRYQPTLLNGAPVEVITEVQVNFRLEK
ncbi:MAG: TonB family protein [Bryobacterales bacterium]|nr:TonB family protein [Bryobacterales bacterium]